MKIDGRELTAAEEARVRMICVTPGAARIGGDPTLDTMEATSKRRIKIEALRAAAEVYSTYSADCSPSVLKMAEQFAAWLECVMYRVHECADGWFEVQRRLSICLIPYWASVCERAQNTTTYFYADDLAVRRFSDRSKAMEYMEQCSA